MPRDIQWDGPDIVWDEPKPKAAEKPPSTIMDIAKSFGSGLLQNIAPFVNGGGPLQTSEADPQFAQTNLPAEEVKPLPGSTYQPQTTVGKYAQVAGNFAPAALGGEASIPARVLGRVLAPAIGSEAARSAAAGTAFEVPAAFAGAMVGGSPLAARAGARATAKALASSLEGTLDPEAAKLVAQYEAMGGHLRPGQYNPSNFVRQGDAVIADTPWPRAAGFAPDSPHAVLPAQQTEEYNRLLSNTFGENAPRITEDVLSRASGRIGKVYEEVLPRNAVRADEDLTAALAGVEDNLRQAAPAMKSANVESVQNVLESLRSQLAENGSIPGKLYQQYRKRGGLLDELASSESPAVQQAGVDLRRAMDDAFARQAIDTDSEALKNARNQYRNLETIRPLAAKAPTGAISPALVLGAVNKEFGSPAAAGDLGTLARVGAAYLKAQPSSGTAERSVWRSLVNKPFSEGIPAIGNAAISLPISALASRNINKVINSPEMRARLLADVLQNPGATNMPPGASSEALAKALRK